MSQDPNTQRSEPPRHRNLRSALVRAVITALLVGPVLVGINHGDHLMVGSCDSVCVWKSILTFLVPFAVSLSSSILALRDRS